MAKDTDFLIIKKDDGTYEVKAHVEKKPNGDVIVNVPSLPLIQKIIKEEKLKENNGKRDIQ